HTGRGQHVEVALQDAVVPSLTSNIAGLLSKNSANFERTGNRHGAMAVAPYNAYRVADGWVTLLCPTEAHWQRLRGVMNDAQADDPRFATMSGRCEHMDDLDEVVGRWTLTRTKKDLTQLLGDLKVPCAPVVTLPELLEDPHIRERGVLRTVTDEQGSFMTLGSPLFLSDSPMVEPTRSGELGEHTDQVLTEELGLSADDIAELRDAGAI
ncbi:CoA transferase, partial [Streptomyces sp. NPDC002896]|uniref:CoA transferase n=1 Tax=Streptomyces sp. NPDC002896 TaxID=3154438 RepID=UPI0033324A0D